LQDSKFKIYSSLCVIVGYPRTCDEVVTSDCAIASTGQNYQFSGQDVTCDTEGLACENGPMQTCLDYKVRFFCSCEYILDFYSEAGASLNFVLKKC